jgi:hypothetical protein
MRTAPFSMSPSPSRSTPRAECIYRSLTVVVALLLLATL